MIKKPVLLIDENKCKHNIENMIKRAADNNLVLRPHFKTHQSLEIGRWFKDFGIDRITVSSVTMAEYFSAEWSDITIAFPVNILEIDEINSLAERVSLNLLVESEETAFFLRDNIKHDAGIFIKIDVGADRTGIKPDNLAAIDSVLGALSQSDRLAFKGFLSHAGHTYNCRSKAEIQKVSNESVSIMDKLKEAYIPEYPDLLTSYGDTPSCSVADDFGTIDEIRPGNFVFYDLMQHQIGAADIAEIGVAVACPVVAVHQDKNEIVIYGGGVHFSKESMTDDEYGLIYGKAAAPDRDGWGKLIPGMYLKKMSQEHGIVHAPDSQISNYKPGDIILILPVHSCMTADVLKSYQTLDGRVIAQSQNK